MLRVLHADAVETCESEFVNPNMFVVFMLSSVWKYYIRVNWKNLRFFSQGELTLLAGQFLSCWLKEYLYLILLSSSSIRNYESVTIVGKMACAVCFTILVCWRYTSTYGMMRIYSRLHFIVTRTEVVTYLRKTVWIRRPSWIFSMFFLSFYTHGNCLPSSIIWFLDQENIGLDTQIIMQHEVTPEILEIRDFVAAIVKNGENG